MSYAGREPQPSDGPDFHAEHAAWERHRGGIVRGPEVFAPAEATQAVMGLLKCYVRHLPEVDVCGTCDSRQPWTKWGCPVAVSIADTLWRMATDAKVARLESLVDLMHCGECGGGPCAGHFEEDDESCRGCEECSGGGVRS